VFPGGRVDAADGSPATLARLDALTPERAAERLHLLDADPPAIAYYVAALREAFEETGILVGVTRNGAPPPAPGSDDAVLRIRDDLLEDRLTFADALARLDCRIAGDSVEYLAHWITPEAEPVRYDTRFFAAAVLGGIEPMIDAREMTHAKWIAPSLAIRAADRGELPMILPTVRTLEQLAGFADTEEALRCLSRLTPPTIMPTLVVTPSGARGRAEDAS
jgi:8-oxo-dGTP pyrophosphatase MutT (NUDIX family)